MINERPKMEQCPKYNKCGAVSCQLSLSMHLQNVFYLALD